MENTLKVAHLSLRDARQCLERENYGRAFANFLLFLKLEPGRHEEVYLEFSLATREWCEELEQSERIEDLLNCYDQACELYPNHDTVLNNIGAQLFRLGYVEEAAAYIRRSLLVNPNYLAARDNLENICSHLVERWHFSMLNDKRRNIAYKFAIEKAVKSGYDTVLDIGTGTGILSLMCESAGARSISACDCSRAMVEVARDVLAANGVSRKVALIHKPSTQLSVPQDLPQKVKLVVTEIFDAGLFGEQAVSTLIDAWRNLISTSPMGTIIPCGATMYVCGIECESIRQQNRLMYPVLQYLDMSQVELLSTIGHVAEEPYTTENLAKVSRGYKIITNISELLRVNFCNLFELESLNKGKDWVCDLYVKQKGSIDALAVWFDLLLDDSITIATGADDRSCWEQAIYPVTNLKRKQGHKNSIARKRETLRTVFHFEQDCLRLVNCEILEENKQSDSSDLSASENCGCHSNSVTPNTSNELTLPFRKRKVEPLLCSTSSSPHNAGSSPCNTIPSPRNTNSSPNNTMSSPHNASSSPNYAIFSPHNESSLPHSASFSPHCASSLPHNTSSSLHSTSSSPHNKSASPHTFDTEYEELSDRESICREDFYDSLRSVTIGSGTDDVQSALNTEECSNCASQSEAKAEDGVCSDCQVLEESECAEASDNNCREEMCHSKDLSEDLYLRINGERKEKCYGKAEKNCLQNDQRIMCLAQQAEVEYINDIYLNKLYVGALERYCKQHSPRKLTLLYLSQRLSFLAIQACKMGFEMVVMVTPDEHHHAIMQVAELNGCGNDSLILIDTANINSVQIEVDALLCDVVEPYGALGQHALENITFQRMTSLNPGGLVLPYEVKIYGMYVESEELENLYHVTDNDRTLDFIVAEYINVFQMQSHMNIDLANLSYNKLSEVFELLSLDLNDTSDSSCNNLLDQRVTRNVPVIATGKISAVIYWFELKLPNNLSVHTVDTRCHWKQAAVMLKDEWSVMTGQNLVTMVTLQNSCLGIKPVLPEAVNGGSCLGYRRN